MPEGSSPIGVWHASDCNPPRETQSFLLIPWAVIYNGPEPTTAKEVDCEAFWGIRFKINRVALVTLDEVAPDSGDGPSSRVIACLNPHLDQEQKIAVLEHQRAFFRGKPVQATLIESNADLETFLRETVDQMPCSFLYFCHATAAQTLNRHLFHDPKSPQDAATIELDKRFCRKFSFEAIRGTLSQIFVCRRCEGSCHTKICDRAFYIAACHPLSGLLHQTESSIEWYLDEGVNVLVAAL